jgi:hypothetical protein
MDAFDDSLEPMLVEFGNVTKLTFGEGQAPLDYNTCPGCIFIESDLEDPEADSGTC